MKFITRTSRLIEHRDGIKSTNQISLEKLISVSDTAGFWLLVSILIENWVQSRKPRAVFHLQKRFIVNKQLSSRLAEITTEQRRNRDSLDR
jgi:hypothetical protein